MPVFIYQVKEEDEASEDVMAAFSAPVAVSPAAPKPVQNVEKKVEEKPSAADQKVFRLQSTVRILLPYYFILDTMFCFYLGH